MENVQLIGITDVQVKTEPKPQNACRKFRRV